MTKPSSDLPEIKVLLGFEDIPVGFVWKKMVESLQNASVCSDVINSIIEAIEITQNKQPDVAIFDMKLLGSQCLDVIQQIKREAPDIIVLIYSVTAEGGKVALDAGADKLLTMPVAPQILNDTILRTFVEKHGYD